MRIIIETDTLSKIVEQEISTFMEDHPEYALAPLEVIELKDRIRAIINGSGLMMKDVLEIFMDVWNEMAAKEGRMEVAR